MEHASDIPPLLNPPRRSFGPLLFCAIVLGLTVAARLSAELHIPFPRCAFMAVTGHPCATCGGTRALRSISHFNSAEAFFWNPLVTIIAAVTLLVALFWAAAPPKAFARYRQKFQRLPWVALGLTAIALNWIYLWIFLPR